MSWPESNYNFYTVITLNLADIISRDRQTKATGSKAFPQAKQYKIKTVFMEVKIFHT